MSENDVNTEGADLSQENGSDQDQQQDQSQDQDQQQDQSQDDYRGKLNATNRFLQKEGYKWNDKSKSWEKPRTSPKPAEAAQESKPAAPDSLSRDEAIVIAKGYSEEELEQAKKVAALEGCKVTEALDKDLFKDWKKRRDDAAKQQQAQLPALRGSKVTQKKSFSTPGLSDEDHKALFNERQGK